MTQELTLKVNARDLARVLPYKAKQDVRYYLNGVSIEPCESGVVLCCTDGHTLAAIFSENSYSARKCILAMDDRTIVEVNRAAKDERSFISVRDEGSVLEIQSAHRQLVGSKTIFVQPGKAFVDGIFPAWRKILPTDEEITEGIPGTYNLEYVHRALESMRVFSSDYRRSLTGVRFYHSKTAGNESALLIRSSADYFVCVMPMRAPPVQAVPAWAQLPIVEVPKAEEATAA